jgi:hypothetical protein
MKKTNLLLDNDLRWLVNVTFFFKKNFTMDEFNSMDK